MKKMVLLFGFILCWMVSYSQIYTFTTAGATGQLGPSQSQLSSAYTGTTLAGAVTGISGVQYWVVPGGGSYLIKAVGASGGGVSAGLGAEMEGTFTLTGGDTLLIVVGQQGVDGMDGSASGGGGSYVVLADPASSITTSLGRKVTPLLVAGGGGGNPGVANADCNANITTNGDNGNGVNGSGIGGLNGNGGGISVPSGNNRGGGGGGFLTDGEHTGTCTNNGEESGLSFLNGCQGGQSTSCGSGQYPGGFGGGGGAISTGWRSSGGGGGYSGGGGGQTNSVAPTHRAGGGGSFNSGTSQVNGVSTLTGNGTVEITVLSSCVSPANLSANVVACDSIILNWIQAADSGIVFFGPTGTLPTSGTLVMGDSTFTVTGTMSNTVYDVYVVNICGGDTSSIFGPVTVNTGAAGAPLADFTALSPAFTTTVDFDASASLGASNTYDWDFGDGSTGTGVTTSHTYATGGSYSVELTVTNACGVSDSTMTLAEVGMEENLLSQSLSVFPNPATDEVTISFEAPQGSAVAIRVLDVSGKEVWTEHGTIDGDCTLPVTHLAPGYYMLEVSAGNFKAIRSLVKQ